MITVNFHGVRGSHPVSDSQMVKYGGNTSCVEIVKTNDKGLKVPIVIDAGTGIIKYGYALTKKIFAGEYEKTITLLFTHLHHDHTEGINFFLPIFLPFCTVHILGMGNIGNLEKNVEKILQEKMHSPMFPVEYSDLKSVRKHHILSDGQVFHINQDGEPVEKAENPLFEVSVLHSLTSSHPKDGAHYYKIVDPSDGTTVVCVWDIESHIGEDVRVIKFAKNADVLVHDSQYTEEEYKSTVNPVQGYGHSTYAMAAENARKANVKRLIFFHYNPRHSDKKLDEIESSHKGKYPFEHIMSYEGLSLTLDKGTEVNRENLNLSFSAY
jgi:phosphoribosyl 1,2-cyclic phosphodiesterase